MAAKKDDRLYTNRICLKCHKEFPSLGLGHRVCGKCAYTNSRIGSPGCPDRSISPITGPRSNPEDS